MSFRPRGVVAMMTLAGALAGMRRTEGPDRTLRTDLQAAANNIVARHYSGWSRGRPSQKAQLKKLRKRRTKNILARASRRRNRRG